MEKIRNLNGTPEEVWKHPELLQLLLPLLRADFELCETYQWKQEAPLDCLLSAYGGLSDSGVPRETILAWREQTRSVPSAFVELAAFPLAPGGKVDRKALMPPNSVQRSSQTAYVAPQNEEERAIAAIWQELLGIDKIGLHDNFFDVGGHSLLVVQLQERLRQRLQATLTLTDLFEHSTIATQVAYLTRDGKETFSFVQPVARAERKNRALQSRKGARQQLKL